MEERYNVLFLCIRNSARSIMVEAIMNQKGKPIFGAYSAGSQPSGSVRPEALKQLEIAKIPTTDLRSKDWQVFAQPDAPPLPFVFTVCDKTASEVCPGWPGQPITAYSGIPDPAIVNGTDEEIELAFRDSFMALERRISLFLSLPLKSLDHLAIKKELDQIGRS
jgi:arsenate reductase